MMKEFKNNPLTEIDGSRVVRIDDYNSSTSTHLPEGEITTIALPKSNVLVYTAEDGTRMAARPSGTEPKIKFYFSVNSGLSAGDEFEESWEALDTKVDRIIEELKLN